MLREYTFGGDGDFTYEALFQRYQSDLGNDLGNLLNRTLRWFTSSSARSCLPRAPRKPAAADASSCAARGSDAGGRGTSSTRRARSRRPGAWCARQCRRSTKRSRGCCTRTGKLDELRDVLAVCCEALRWAALMVAPAMPAAAREILRQLGRSRR